ncbi:MAG: phosphatase PAP2 family protein [Vicinamibacterales bacterium]
MALSEAGWQDVWFTDVGNSFPSGHAVLFWGLCFPLLVVAPRLAWPFAVLAVAISAARVAANDHYVSDVLASAALAAVVTWLASLILQRQDRT